MADYVVQIMSQSLDWSDSFGHFFTPNKAKAQTTFIIKVLYDWMTLYTAKYWLHILVSRFFHLAVLNCLVPHFIFVMWHIISSVMYRISFSSLFIQFLGKPKCMCFIEYLHYISIIFDMSYVFISHWLNC